MLRDIAPVVMVVLIVCFINFTEAYATSNVDRGILGNTNEGFSDGKAEGISDARSGNYNPTCPPTSFIAYCTGWLAGYEAGFNAERFTP